jgi:hypothetical protein
VALSVQRIAELRALCEADAYELEGECLRCRSAMHIPEDLEPTVVCDLCAQEIVATALPEVLDEIERLTAERDAAEAERDAARSGRSYFQDLADRRGDALLALGHDYFDAEHVLWCEPCRGVREGGGE